jgi:2-polyprenyl-3-methyl-5-hydroxy-6-metoxy-1,4-benzoquinol methylase
MSNIAATYTDGSYARKNPKFGDDNADWKIANALNAIKQFGIAHTTVAEVGCGAGAIIQGLALKLSVDRAVGYEPMPEAFAVAKQRETDRLRFVNGSVEDIADTVFDLALCFDVFEHVEDCYQFLRSLRRIASGFLFHIPLDMSVQMVARMKPIMRARASVGHLHYFSKDTALQTLVDCGFRIGGWFYTCGAEGNYGGRAYQLLKWPRKIAYCVHKDLAVRFLGGYSLMVHATREF